MLVERRDIKFLVYLYLDSIVCSLESVRERMAKIDRKVDLSRISRAAVARAAQCLRIECVRTNSRVDRIDEKR